ncbi:MAG: hypothetical protein NC489_39245, partial [Ruminococcus flavefaciens]|nr:hypothetical protein [Ruminococcus flavefaciens]
TPSDKAVSQAVFTGSAEVLDILLGCGYSFDRKPEFLKKACRAAFNDGGRMLKYMLAHGYTYNDSYDGKTLRENARIDGNTAALAVIDNI